jgi:hypothetical protein
LLVLPNACFVNRGVVCAISIALWAGWLALLGKAGLQRLPYAVHVVLVILAFGWCLAGAGIVAIGI